VYSLSNHKHLNKNRNISNYFTKITTAEIDVEPRLARKIALKTIEICALFVCKCVSVKLMPSLSACDAKIYAGGSVVAQSDCSADGVDPVPVWLSTSSPTRIQVSYRADFTADRTPRVDYVQNSPVPLGITLATFSLSLPTGCKSHQQHVTVPLS